MKRTTAAPPIGARVLEPRGAHGETLAPLTVSEPPGGWTVALAADAAWTYASEHGLGRTEAYRAFSAISDAYAPARGKSLRIASIKARFAGEPDPFDPLT